MFQLVCDPSGVVVDTSLQVLVPAVVKWGNKLDHILRVLLSLILSSTQVCLSYAIDFSHLIQSSPGCFVIIISIFN